ncbi:hypothetical protein RHGRI_014288 [Rhododendron griersonianum]|uniref:Uncharacterized protein n=1 Tax=Rhododendron griersonianum TaxID=479676 RepID=A0AAV6K9C7_9ERIC|nr:hypothetical protein RHGRI_014288 [Rhododendron griersonianum]
MGHEMLDGCRALLAIATVTMPLVFDQLLKSIRGDMELSGMGYLIRYLDCSSHADNTGLKLPPERVNAATNLFALIVESELKAAPALAFIDESESEYLQASITAIDATIPLLTRLFSERFARLHEVLFCFLYQRQEILVKSENARVFENMRSRIWEFKGRGTKDPTETLEELYSLLLLMGHILADEGEGEMPLKQLSLLMKLYDIQVPNAIQTHFVDSMEIQKHLVIVQKHLVIAVIWFTARWYLTYLMPTEETTSSGDHTPYLQPQYSSRGSWHDLANAFANERTLFSLNDARQLYSSHNIGKVDFSSDSSETQGTNISQVPFCDLFA